MKAVGYTRAGAIDDDGALVDVELPQPTPEEHDLLVKVHAVSVNPVDCTIRATEQPRTGQPRILGYDAVGTIIALVDAGKMRSTLTSTIGAINAATLAQAHRLIESGRAVGKLALEGFTS